MERIIYPFVETFAGIQGEGTFMGMGATFIRLAGCNLRCAWCDTTHSFDVDRARRLTVNELLQECPLTQPLVVITGGEPTLYNLQPLVAALHKLDKRVTIETNGTNPVPTEWGLDWVTVSPKPGSNYAINCRPNELKYVVDDRLSVTDIAADRVPPGHVYLQIESCRGESARKAYKMVVEHPELKLRVGIQLHKILGVE